MRREILVAGTILALTFSIPALAQGRSGGAAGGAGVGAAGSAGPSAPSSSQRTVNGNGPNAADRDTGRDRAEDRMSKQGLANNKAGIADTDVETGDAKAAADKAKARKANESKAAPNGGKSSTDISAQGKANTNGPNAADRDTGRDRAKDRKPN